MHVYLDWCMLVIANLALKDFGVYRFNCMSLMQAKSIFMVGLISFHILSLMMCTLISGQSICHWQEGTIWYVTPLGDSCFSDLENSCFDINTYVQNVSKYFVSNTTFIFLPGIHLLYVTSLVQIQNVENLCLISSNNFTQSSIADDVITYNFEPYEDDSNVTYLESLTNITCNRTSGFFFSNVTNLYITNLTITNCGVFSPVKIKLSASIHLVNITNLWMEGVTIKNSTGYGLLGVNVLGQALIMRSSFIGNNQLVKDACTKENITLQCNNLAISITSYLYKDSSLCSANGGNLYIQYEDPIGNTSNANTLLLSDLTFSLGIDGSYPDCNHSSNPGTGLALVMSQSSFFIKVNIQHTTSYRNQGSYGANFYFEVVSSSDIAIYDAHSKLGISLNGSVYYHSLQSSKVQNNATTQFSISNSIFECNYGVACASMLLTNFLQSIIIVENSIISNDTSGSGASVVVENLRNLVIYFTNCTFRIIQLDKYDGSVQILGPLKTQLYVSESFIMYTDLIFKFADVYVINSTFNFALVTAIRSTMICSGIVTFQNSLTHGSGGAISLYFSVLIINKYANVQFLHNHATLGGALFIDLLSTINFTSPCNVSFTNNSAVIAGGAIYVQGVPQSVYIKMKCFFQFNDTSNAHNVDVYFEGNSAGDAGSVLYGGNIDYCTLDYCNEYRDKCNQSPGSTFDMIAHYGNHDDSVSQISSDPTMICFCNQSMPLNCSNAISEPIFVYPGEVITQTILTLGQRQGTAPGVIYIYYKESDITVLSALRSSNHCDVYTIPFRNEYGSYNQYMTIDNSFSFNDTNNTIALDITVLPCPTGFIVDHSSFRCVCNELLHTHGVTCEINNKVFSWTSEEKWIGNTSDGVLGVVDDCPYDYCNDAKNVSLDSDLHCSFNHCGVMCGQCCAGLSMKFGSSQCGECSNYYFLLLIPFALMGVIVVFFLIAINFTVANGTINGLVLYAFVIKLNIDIFFSPSCGKEYVIMNILSIFVAWFNFDLGIETCFYEGMTSSDKVWLQFAFPAYVAFILLVIVVAGNRSTTISRLCRYNMVPVMGTLILLLYSKMLRVLFNIFTFSRMYTSNDTYQFVWTYDGNIPYLGPQHVGVFIVGVLVTMVFMVPYTLLLLLTPYLVKLSHWRVFCWMNKMKPLVDCYEAPFKDRYRFWTGAMLIYRIALGTMSTLFGSQQPTLILLAIVVVHAAIVFSGFAIYKSWIISALESVLHTSIVVNSLVLFIFIQGSYQCSSLATAVCASIAFICFLAVLAHNIYMQCRDRQINGRSCLNLNSNEKRESPKAMEYEYREPLLDTDQ